jgi:DNA-binding GntR family transcriptional regulator
MYDTRGGDVPVPRDRRTVISRRLHKDEVFDSVRAAILAGDLPAGARLRDPELEAWLGVSRTPIRTALVRLERIGLVEGVPQRWTRVARARPAVVPDLVVSLCAVWRDLPREGHGLLAPGGARRANRRLLERCSEAVAALGAASGTGVAESRAVVDAAFACVARLEGDGLPEVTAGLLGDLGSQLRHQAALLGRRLDVGPVTACLAQVRSAVDDGDPHRLRSAVDELARRTATIRPALAEPRSPWWRR